MKYQPNTFGTVSQDELALVSRYLRACTWLDGCIGQAQALAIAAETHEERAASENVRAGCRFVRSVLEELVAYGASLEEPSFADLLQLVTGSRSYNGL